MVSDAIVAIVADDVMPDILTAIHRAGLGHTARVLRPARAPIGEQLRRAGVPTAGLPERVDAAPAVLLVMAAARSPFAADLALRHGASATWIVTRAGAWNLVDDRLVATPASEPASPQAPQPAFLAPAEDDRTAASGA